MHLRKSLSFVALLATFAIGCGNLASISSTPQTTPQTTPQFAYVANFTSNNVSAFSINATTGALTTVGSPVAAGTGPISVAADPKGKFLYIANLDSNDVSAFTINGNTG